MRHDMVRMRSACDWWGGGGGGGGNAAADDGMCRDPGYGTFYPDMHDYDVQGAPSSWARVPAMRHAMSLNPHTPYFFHLDQRALIMNRTLTVKDHIMDPSRLESLMLKDVPVVPPDSIIRTFSHLKPDHVDLVLTQDDDGLALGSMIMRRGPWADYFLDSWFDPIYRTYNFQNAEAHALVGSIGSPLPPFRRPPPSPPPPPPPSLPSSLVSSRLVVNVGRWSKLGTPRPVAPYHPRQASPGPSTDHERIQHRRHAPRGSQLSLRRR